MGKDLHYISKATFLACEQAASMLVRPMGSSSDLTISDVQQKFCCAAINEQNVIPKSIESSKRHLPLVIKSPAL
jgi:hypothetical protein